MTPERLAEIHAQAARWAEGDLKNPTATSVFRHRAELLQYVEELKHNLRGAGECIDAYITACARGEAERVRLRRELADAAAIDRAIADREAGAEPIAIEDLAKELGL